MIDAKQFTYSLKPEEAGTPVGKESMIQKRGHVIEFSLAELEANHAEIAKVRKQIAGQREVELAKMKNVEQFHADIAALPPIKLHAAKMYAEAKNIFEQCEAKLQEIDERIADDQAEIEEIKSQIPAMATVAEEKVEEVAAEVVAGDSQA